MHAFLLVALMAGGAAASAPADPNDMPAWSQASSDRSDETAWNAMVESSLIDSYLDAEARTEARFPDFPLVGAAPLVGLALDTQTKARASVRCLHAGSEARETAETAAPGTGGRR